MADAVYPDFDGDVDAAPSDAMSWIIAQRRAAQQRALTSLDDSPDDATRAQELSEATGANPALVYGDLENFEQQHKAALTSALLTNNQYLRDYANSHPLAAKISNDDWGQLDAVSQSLQKLGMATVSGVGTVPTSPNQITASIGAVARVGIEKAKEGFGTEPIIHAIEEPSPVLDRFSWSLQKGLYNPLEALIGTLVGTSMRGMSAATMGAAGAIGEIGRELGYQGAPETAQSIAQALMDPGFYASMPPIEGVPVGQAIGFLMRALHERFIGKVTPEVEKTIDQSAAQVADAAKYANPWTSAGKAPPVGHPLIDELYREEAKHDNKALDEALAEVQKSSTKERSPELMANFIRQHTDATIGIDAEAVRKLYGDKEPTADDNVLGFVPQIADQLRLAEAHGGDIEVPLADWLAKVDPEVAKELHDNIRVRPGGMTLEEAGEAKPEMTPEEEEYGNRFAQPEKEEAKAASQPQLVADPAVAALRQSTALSQPILGQPAVQRGIIPQKTILGQVELGKELRDADTFPASDALKEVDKNQLTGVPRALTEFFENRLEKMAGDTPIWVLDHDTMTQMNKNLGHPENTPGFYHPDLHAIILHQNIANGRFGHNLATHILYHEIAHAATARELRNFPNLAGAVRSMMDETDRFLSATEPETRKYHNYAFKNEEEFIAEAFSNPKFQEVLASTPLSKELAQKLEIGGRTASTVWDAVRGVIRNLIQKLTGIKDIPDTIMDGVLRLGPTFEEAQRRLTGEAKGKTALARPIQGELDVTRLEDKDLFEKASAIGMTVKSYKHYQELIAKRQEEDLTAAKEKAVADERLRQTAEWKENAGRVREEAAEAIRNQPDIAADRFLREGELYGQKVQRRRLNAADLTPEQKAALDPEHFGNNGIHPDDAAGLFGYTSGDGMVAQLGRLKQERELEGLTPAAHLRQLVDVETERRMKGQYGDLEQNILDEAKDNVITPTQIDLLHEETLHLAELAKAQMSISKEDMRRGAKELFDRSNVGQVSSDKFLAAAGRAGRAAEEALLGEKPQDAFKAKQQQYVSILLAQEARRFEKLQAQDTRLRKRLSAAAPKGIDPEYAIWAQDIISRTGGFVRRTLQGMARQRELVSPAKDLREFVEKVNSNHQIWGDDPDNMPMGRQMPVADFLLNQDYRKATDQMTVEEFKQVAGALKTIDKNGREFNKYTVKGEKRELEDVVGGLIDRLKAAVGGKRIGNSVEQTTSAWRTIGSLMLNPESWFKRLDLGNNQGPFSQLIVRKVTEGQYTKATLEREQAKEFRKIADVKEGSRKIDNPIFMDPNDEFKSPLPLTRENLRVIMHNMGNELQRKKLAGGYGIKNPDDIWRWLFSVTKKEDWEPVQQMGEFFNNLFRKSEEMYSQLNGWVPDRIQLGTIQTPWGEMKEWYHPLIPNPLFHGSGLKAADMMEESGYYKPSPASGYTKGRTGAIYPIDLTSRGIDTKIKQIINDIAMRPAITEVSKIVLNRKFRDAFTQYYGKEYARALEPWLKDSAGNRRYVPSTDAAVDTAANYIRENMSSLMIGLNIGTVAKHFPTALAFSMQRVGPVNFVNSMLHMFHETDEGISRRQFAMENSEELQNRLRSMAESISASNQDMFRKYSWDHKFFSLRDAIRMLGSYPVAMSDFISAVPMWDAAYRKFLIDHPDAEHGDAVDAANTAVRQTHGSTITSNRPAIMRMNPWVQSFMPFYNFFNNAANRLYEYGWKAKLATQGRDLPEMTGFEREQFERGMKHIPEVLGGFLTYGVIVSLVEQAIDPLQKNPQDNPIWYGAKVIGRGPLSMIPGLRDLMNVIWEGHDATAGIIGSFYSQITRPLTSGGHIADPGKVIRRANAIFGAFTGLTYDEVGKVGQYVHSVMTGQEHPHSFVDYYKGIRHGTQKEFRR